MQLSKLIAKMAAILYLSTGLGALFDANYYYNIAEDLFSNAGLTYLAGFITVVFGLLIVNYHNRWVKNWTVVITVIGWLALLKGIVLIVCPQWVYRLSEEMLTGCGPRIFPYTSLCVGLLFAYFGFVSKAAPPDKSP